MKVGAEAAVDFSVGGPGRGGKCCWLLAELGVDEGAPGGFEIAIGLPLPSNAAPPRFRARSSL